jgi:serine/threonine protein kinase
VTSFKEALGQYLTGELGIDGLEAALVAELNARPQTDTELLAYLETLYAGSRITHPVYATLKRRLVAGAGQSKSDDSPKTTFKQNPATAAKPDDLTVHKPHKTEGGTPSGPGTNTGTGAITGQTTGHTGSQTGTSRGLTGNSGWTDTTGTGPGMGGPPLGIGSTVDGKYYLEELLGEGGMGSVYKARDLDAELQGVRNPYVALKLLTEDFRQHKDSARALAKEANRTRGLNHDNIVVVSVFARDRSTGQYYMVMELLEGEPLDRFIRRHPDGIPLKEALPIVEGLCNGLHYAHSQPDPIVHSDFKPGNAYLTNSGKVKVFDFGIARAARRRVVAVGDRSVFDPGDLGAITPPYASLEMLAEEGSHDPAPQDDIYALACVTYELLTGHHPFDKTPADKARDRKLVPNRPKGLSWRQWRALRRGLAFERSARTPTAAEFLESVKPQQLPPWLLFGLPVVVLLVIALLWVVIPQVLEARKLGQLEAVLLAGKPEEIAAIIPELQALPPGSQSQLLPKGSPARNQLLAYFETRVKEQFDPAKNRYGYVEAGKALEQLERIVEGDAINARRALDDRQREAVDIVGPALERLKDQGCLVEGTAGCSGTVVATYQVLRQLKPDDSRLDPKGVLPPFQEQAEAAFGAGDLDRARRLVSGGLSIAPTDNRLKGLESQIRAREDEARITALESRLDAAVARWNALADVDDSARSDFAELRKSREFGATVTRFRLRYYELLSPEVERLAAENRLAEARALIDREAGAYLSPDDLGRLNAIIEGVQAPVGPTAEQQFATASGNVDQLLAKPDFSAAWAVNLADALKQLEEVPLSGAGDAAAARRARAVGLFVGEARNRARKNDFAGGERLLEAADLLLPGTDIVRKARADVEQLKIAANQAGALAQQVASLKAKIDGAASNGDDRAVRTLIDELRKIEPADPWLKEKAPEAFAKAFTSRGRKAFDRQDYPTALSLVTQALKAKPDYKPAQDLRKQIDDATSKTDEGDATRQPAGQILDSLSRQFKDFNRPLDGTAIAGELARAKKADPALYASREDDLIGDLVFSINRLARVNPEGARARCDIAIRLFKGLECPPIPESGPNAAQILENVSRQLNDGTRPIDVASLSAELTRARALDAALVASRLGELQGDLLFSINQLREKEPDAARLRCESATRLFPGYDFKCGSRVSPPPPVVNPPPQPPPVVVPPRPPAVAGCAGKLAGASCRDVLPSGKNGPGLIVLPGGGPSSGPVAMSKYEVSAAEYNAYCAAAGCPSRPGGSLPVTGIAAADAEAYAAWLSEATGEKYRLPSSAEWAFAARAGDKEAPNKICWIPGRHEPGQRPLGDVSSNERGVGAETTRNGFGLVNMVGNAREFVKGGGGFEARGGAHVDSFDRCSTDLVKPGGEADPATGFRVVREIR